MIRWERKTSGSKNCVEVDRWDRQGLHQTLKSMRSLARARKNLKTSSDTGAEAVDDAFYALHKASPRLEPLDDIDPTFWVNRTVAAEFAALSSTTRMRLHTVGDSVAAAQACIDLIPSLEGIFDRLEVEQAQAVDVQDLIAEAMAAIEVMSVAEEEMDDVDPDDLEGLAAAAAKLAAAQAGADEAKAKAEAAAGELADSLDAQADSVRVALREAMGPVAERQEEQAETAAAWGVDPAALRRLDPEARLKLARELDTNRMREIADLFGRIRNLAWSESAKEINVSFGEIRDLEAGDDLARVVPAEFLWLDEETENVFYSRLADRELLQYSMESTEEQGRGGIVMCVDGSGSMNGVREMWAKALMLVLLHLARQQKRTMHVIHFGSPGHSRHLSFTEAAHFTAERIIDAASVFYGGGTDFETPMSLALDVLRGEFGATGSAGADVVFATDGECLVRPSFMKEYRAEMERMGARTWGVSFGRNSYGALEEMSDSPVMTVSDLTGGGDVRDLLRGTR